jgi:uncharacterized protein (DUF885 family)
MMTRIYHSALLCIALASLTACGRQGPPPESVTADSGAPHELLSHLVERYWDENAALRPWYSWGSAEMRFGEAPADTISPQALADSLAIERRYLAQVLDIARSPLNPDSKVTYDMFLRERRLAIEGFTYPSELLPVNPFDSVPQRFALMASAAERYGVSSDQDLANWLSRADMFGRWTNQAISNMREGMRRGYTLPRLLIERMLPQLAALGEDSPANAFYQPLREPKPAANATVDATARVDTTLPVDASARVDTTAPVETTVRVDAAAPDARAAGSTPAATPAAAASEAPAVAEITAASAVTAAPARSGSGVMSDAERARLSAALALGVKEKILPPYRALHDFLQKEYLPRCRDSVGLSALPLGESWYAYLVLRATGGSLTPSELHTHESADVERLRGRLKALLAETAFAGNPDGFLDSMRRDPRFSYKRADELMAAYRDLKTQVRAVTTAVFPAPRADFDIRSVEAFREETAPLLSYRRATAFGKNPAVLYVDTADLDARPAVALAPQFLREAVPGHHFQLAIQQERADLPRFRRFGGVPAFIEGWGLYAASLGEELGVYRDPETKFGALLAELGCAAGAVVDTGLHSQRWSRQQALDYLRAQMPIDAAAAANVVDRAIALPADALACSAGFAKIQGLRARAQQVLGTRFDLLAFHIQLLKDGAVPLDILEGRINQWMETAARLD